MEICRLPARVLPGTSPVLFTKRTFPAATASPSPSQSANLAESRMFMLGTGYVGQFFGQQLHRQGWLSVLQSLKSCTHLLVSIPSLAGLGDPLLKHQHLLRDALIDGSLQWLCYLSSTASPSTEVAKARLLAENGWLNFGHSLGLSTQVFRLGGIYGPGRSAVDTVMKQKPLSERQKMRASGQYTSRVHVEDICQALWASIKIPSFRRIYNIVDDDPAPREEVFAYAEDLVKKKWPDLIKQRSPSEEDMSSDVVSQRSSRGEKRVSNTRMKRELGVKLHHPSYRSGLISITEQLSL
ncbi:hypothetical protein LINPERPRIM_LOCUS29368 [Linum perenne]